MSRYSTMMNKKKVRSNFLSETRVFPELSDDMKEKLEKMFEEFFELHGRKYSTLTLNEKRLVEMFCARTARNSEGLSPKQGEEKFSTLMLGYYATAFFSKAMGVFIAAPPASKFHIVEDERMNIDDLYGESFKYNGDPFASALMSYPDQYLPVRASKGKAEIWAVAKPKKPTDMDSYLYKTRESIFPNEIRYGEYPLLELIAPEELKRRGDVIKAFNDSMNPTITDEIAELYLEYRKDWRAFNAKYGIEIDKYEYPNIESYIASR